MGAGGTFVFDPAAYDTPATAAERAPVAAVPEPATLALLVAALGGAVVYCRFSRRRDG